MANCPNCGQETARTEDWACQWCGYPLLSKSYKKIPRIYAQLREDKIRGGQSSPQQEGNGIPLREVPVSKEVVSRGEDISGWEICLIIFGIVVTNVAVASLVVSLTTHLSWFHFLLLFPTTVAIVFVAVSNKLWLQIPFFAALGILVIYTIRGIILGDIDLIIPRPFFSP